MCYENKIHVEKVSLLWSNKRNPANILCSESLEKGLKNMFKINNKDTRTTSLTWFRCRYFYPRTYFQLFLARSSVSIADFEHVYIYWEQPQLNTLFFQNLFCKHWKPVGTKIIWKYNFCARRISLFYKTMRITSLWG